LVVDVFTDTALQGNPLAVFPDAPDIDGATMQRIARELNLSETVFVSAPDGPDALASVRIFTPMQELRFAGHPTIGTAFVLTELGRVPPDAQSIVLSEGVGPVPVRLERRADPFLGWLRTPPITFGRTFDPEACARASGLSPSVLLDAPPQIVSAGNPFLFVALRDPGMVDSVALDLAALERAVPPTETTGHFVFAPVQGGGGGSGGGAYSRMFAARAGIAEDPATGSGTGPLAAYMTRYGLVPLRDGGQFTSTQGVHMGRPSKLHVILHARAGTLDFVEVGGSAVRLIDATLTLPA